MPRSGLFLFYFIIVLIVHEYPRVLTCSLHMQIGDYLDVAIILTQ